MKISVLVPFISDNGERERVWEYCKRRYEQIFPNLELVVGVDTSEPYCKAKAVNEAARNATGDVFMITDADIIFEPDLISAIAGEINHNPWLQPFLTCYKLSRAATERLIVGEITDHIEVNRAECEQMRLTTEAGPYICVVSREWFTAVAGFDERFKGYGWQDLTFAAALNAVCGHYHQLDMTIYHLWHPSCADRSTAQFKANYDLYNRYKMAAARAGAAGVRKIIAERFEGNSTLI